MKRFLLAAVLTVAAALALPAVTLDYSFGQMVMDSWNDRSGLPSNSVLDVLQDARGYIWIASYDGLIRFDGRSFTVFSKESDAGFNSNSARVLLAGKDGTLWIGTNTDGLFSYRDGVFKSWGKAQGLPDLSVRTLAVDSFGKLWVGTAGGIAVLEGDTFRLFAPGEGIATFLLPMGDGSVLVGSNKAGLWKSAATGLERLDIDPVLAKQPVFSAAIDQRNRLWLGAGDGSILVVQGNKVVERVVLDGLKGGSAKRFLSVADGTMWIATDKGLFYGQDGRFRHYSEANGLPNDSVTSLCQDREGSLWVGTERGGVVKYSPGKFLNVTQREGLAGNSVNAVSEDRYGSLWVGSDQGLAFFADSRDPYGRDAARTRAVNAVLADLGKSRIRQIRSDKAGRLWFATYSDWGLYVFDGQGSWHISQKEGLPVNRVRLTMEDRQGRVWIGTTAGLVVRANGALSFYGKAQGLVNEFILDVHEASDGAVWVGLDGGGVARLEPNGRFKSWTTADGLAGNVVFRFHTDGDGRLWICTSDGLSLFTGDGFRSFRARDGLLSDSVYQILQESGGGKFWLVTSRGLAVVAPDTLVSATGPIDKTKVRVIDRLDGLAGQPSANSWAFRNSTGVLFFPTIGGLSIFNPQSVSVNPTPPPVLLEAIIRDGVNGIVPADQWDLAPGTQRLVFKFTALSYMVPQKVGFRYRLEGYDSQWITAPNGERTAVYTNLPPGDYTFRVQAWNNDGVVNEAGASTRLSVRPWLWQTVWFYLLCAAVLVGSGFGVNLVRLRAANRRKAELERLVAERTEDLHAEKQKSEALLRNVLPEAVVEELKQHGQSEPLVHQDVAVMFADLVNFTATSASMTPAQTISELNELFSAFDEIAARNGCERIKTIGDAYLAVAGLDGAGGGAKDRAASLVRCAREMLAYLDARRSASPIPWRVRIGIHCGPVVGGVVGVKKYIYDIFGDTVNTASRMEAESHPGRITVTGATAALLAGTVSLENRGLVDIKGKGDMELFFVV